MIAKLGDYERDVFYVVDLDQLLEEDWEDLYSSEVIGLDIETFRKGPFLNNELATFCPYQADIRLLQLAPESNDLVYVFDLLKIPTTDRLVRLLKHRGVKYVAHNAMFEMKFLDHNRMLPPHMNCTMMLYELYLAAVTSQPTQYKVNLESTVQAILGAEMTKGLGASDWGDVSLSKEQIEYAAIDALACVEMYPKLCHSLSEFQMEEIYELNRRAMYPVSRMGLQGIGFDWEQHQELMADWEEEIEVSTRKLSRLLPKGLNVNSSTQLSKYLKEYLDPKDLDAWPKTKKTGKLKTDAEVLQKFSRYPVVGPLLNYKKYKKLHSTYGKTLVKAKNPVTKRIHPTFTLCKTETGRLSCFSPNVQNQPRGAGMRELYKPANGNIYIVADYGQIELRCAAELSQDAVMKEVYTRDEDLHRRTAANLQNIAEEEVTKEDRQLAKAVNFGLLFGMEGPGLKRYAEKQYGVAMSLEEANSAVDVFRKTYPQLALWQQSCIELARIQFGTVSPTGKCRALNEKNYYTCSMNTPVQAAAAEVMLNALVLMDVEYRNNPAAKIVNCVHDEMVVECPEEIVDQVKASVISNMVAAYEKVFPNSDYGSVDKLVEANIGYSWEEAK